jgi:hypothetical protein
MVLPGDSMPAFYESQLPLVTKKFIPRDKASVSQYLRNAWPAQ